VGVVIERLHGVHFGQAQVWRILGALARKSRRSAPLNVTGMRCAVGSAALGPALKKARREGRLSVFVDASGSGERPTRVRTWAPKGQTPTIQFHFLNPFLDVSGQLDPRFGHRWAHPHQLPVPAARGQYQERRDRRIPQGTQGPLDATAAGDPGWIEGAPQPLLRERLDRLKGTSRSLSCRRTRRT